jgi:hypothetical protein
VIVDITVNTFGQKFNEPIKTEGVLAYERKWFLEESVFN